MKLLREYQQLSDSEWLQVVKYYQNHTARESAEKFGLVFKQALVTALAREVQKDAGHGGRRRGSGNLNGDNRKVREISSLIRQARTLQGLHALPDPDNISPDNASKAALDAANILRLTIANMKKIIENLEKVR